MFLLSRRDQTWRAVHPFRKYRWPEMEKLNAAVLALSVATFRSSEMRR
jgi:hypothetical protein